MVADSSDSLCNNIMAETNYRCLTALYPGQSRGQVSRCQVLWCHTDSDLQVRIVAGRLQRVSWPSCRLASRTVLEPPNDCWNPAMFLVLFCMNETIRGLRIDHKPSHCVCQCIYCPAFLISAVLYQMPFLFQLFKFFLAWGRQWVMLDCICCDLCWSELHSDFVCVQCGIRF